MTVHQARPALLGHQGYVKSVKFSPDGGTLVSAGSDQTVRFWNVATSTQINILRGHTEPIVSLAFAPDGQSLVSTTSGTVKLWDALPRGQRDVVSEHAGWVDAVAVAPDGRTLVTSDYHTLALKLWDVPTRSLLVSLEGHTGIPRAVAFSPDGKLLASGGGDQTVRLWDLDKHRTVSIHRCDSGVETVAFSADGQIVAAIAGGLKLWNVSSEREVDLITGDPHSITQVAFSRRTELFATADKDGQVVVWDADGDVVASFSSDTGGISSLSFSSGGDLIAVAQVDGMIALFDVTKQVRLHRFQAHKRQITQVAFAPDAMTLASASFDSTVRLWNVATGKAALVLRHIGPVTDVSFSYDGRLMATSGADATARLWRAASLDEAEKQSENASR